MVSRKRAEELARKFLFSQERLWPIEINHVAYNANDVQAVLLDYGPYIQAYLLVYPDEQVELIFFGEHDALNI